MDPKGLSWEMGDGRHVGYLPVGETSHRKIIEYYCWKSLIKREKPLRSLTKGLNVHSFGSDLLKAELSG